MNPRHKPFVWIVAVVAAGLLAVLVTRGLGGSEAPGQAARDAAPPASPSAPPQQPAPPDMPTTEPTPPWAQSAGVGGAGTQVNALPAPAQLPALSQQDTRAALASIRQQSQHNMAAADTLLRELDQLERSGNAPADMNVEALRTNLVIAKRAQVLALELAESTQQPESDARQRRTEAIVAELQSLQGKLRYDVGGAPAGGAVPARTQ